MTMREPVSELDLLAYADGLLDHDPGRKAQVEAYLREAPAEAVRVKAYAAQTQALRDTYDPRADEPVPQALLDTLSGQPRRSRAAWMRAAAMVAVSVGAGLVGWYLGQHSARAPDLARQPVASVLRGMAAGEQNVKQASSSTVVPDGELRWRNEGVALSLRVPDLASLGYDLTARRNVSQDGAQAVALTYEAADGTAVQLFIAPKAHQRGEAISVERQDGTSVAFWGQGPLAFAAVTKKSDQDFHRLAERIRDVLLATPESTPEEHPTPGPPVPPGSRVEVTADAVSPRTQGAVDAPLGHAPLGVDKRIE